MPRIDRDACPIDSLEFDPPKRSPISSEDTIFDSSLSSFTRTPSPKSTRVYISHQPPQHQPIRAIRRPSPVSIHSSPETEPQRPQFRGTAPDYQTRRGNRYAPPPPNFPPIGTFAPPGSAVVRTAAARGPTRFWTPGQEKWHKALLDAPLMDPGEYRAWKKTKWGEPCHTYTMYISNFRRHIQGLVPAPCRVMTDGRELPMKKVDRKWVVEETIPNGTDHNKITSKTESINIEKHNTERSDTEGKDTVPIVNAVKAIQMASSPPHVREIKTPGSERRSRRIKGERYSLVLNISEKKRILSDVSDVEKHGGRVKRRSVGFEEAVVEDQQTDVGYKTGNDSGDEMEGVEPTG